MSAHTPGPWKFVHDEPYEMAIETVDGQDVLGLELWLDDVCFDLNGERVANGKLAAAAPALADALLAAYHKGAHENGCSFNEGVCTCWIGQADTALRAAGRLP